ncbi:MAG: DUF4435 domain-containing protein [Anaerolineaceae bacterium]|nr:DUF4435 domain-containing protein [Anaerolineaceae bacterium]
MSFTLTMPSRNGPSGEEKVTIEGNSIVIVGANGSGKSRLADWLDRYHSQGNQVHRILAQRNLVIEDNIQSQPIGVAMNLFWWGVPPNEHTTLNYVTKNNRRFRGRVFRNPISDFTQALILLFARRNERDYEYAEASKQTNEKVPLLDSADERIKTIWKKVFPHRELVLEIKEGTVSAQVIGSPSENYHASELSDGEKAALYLMAVCLCLPENKYIVVDEPELHLHRAILAKLWDELESIRSDCLFVYITHDMDFAVSRTAARKLVLKGYEHKGQLWQWDEVPTVEDIPNEVLLKILGTRRPVLFVEGEKGSPDYAIYQALYPNYLVIPRNSCTEVIQSTKSLRKLTELPTYRLQVFGIIDRDFRDDNEIENLNNDGVCCPQAAIVENLFCTREVMEEFARKLGYSGSEIGERCNQAIENVFTLLNQQFEPQISKRTADRFRAKLDRDINTKIKSQADWHELVDKLKAEIDSQKQQLYDENSHHFQRIVDTRDYEGALLFYRGKDLISAVSSAFGRSKNDYEGMILRYLRQDIREDSEKRMIQAFRKYVPELPGNSK